MHARSLFVVFLLAASPGCGAPAPTRLPGQVEGLGTATTDCVETCRTLFAGCTAVTVFVDHAGYNLTPADCARTCADELDYDASLEAAGCVEEWAAYETCVLGNVDTDCSVSACSIDWGVYEGCIGP